MTETVFDKIEQDMDAGAASLFADIAIGYLARTRSGSGPVSTARTPPELAERFQEPLPEAGVPLANVARRVERDILSDMNRLMHPMYMGHQVSAPLPAAIWMEAVIAAMNQSIAVYEMSPSATAVESQLITWMCSLAGFGAGSGGTFTSGGTEATLTALLAARAAALPGAWENGVDSEEPPLVLYGEHAHYAVGRAVAELGLGLRRAIPIPSSGYKMDANALEGRIDQLEHDGKRIMAVVATAGSTPTGAFDDLDSIGRVCEARGIWLHVDGAHGASALFSAKHRDRLRGLHLARSLAWDPHKMLLMPLQAGMLLMRDEGDLHAAFAQQAPYLFHTAGWEEREEGARSWDQGRRSFMCSRRADGLKLWVALQRYGGLGMGELYDHLCATTAELHQEVGEKAEFEAIHEPECNILCFRYVGSGQQTEAELDHLNMVLRERYNLSGAGWITTTVLDGRRVLRVTMMNPRTKRVHLLALLDGLAREAHKLTEPV